MGREALKVADHRDGLLGVIEAFWSYIELGLYMNTLNAAELWFKKNKLHRGKIWGHQFFLPYFPS